ncbi:alpha/beta hydrolase [Rhodocytophaga rosea]|uniref:Alpha/beta hydrolase n=1 Tax=Rhodocytophaga rosea TaxID=2704465 RepID=A0A6C0GGE8_9BACT|nr:alpha/beta hydrolase [Rhodocytophaga rosea]QHT66955.1 alpha/beta hydrolase [Rhodocytophaga rosea]
MLTIKTQTTSQSPRILRLLPLLLLLLVGACNTKEKSAQETTQETAPVIPVANTSTPVLMPASPPANFKHQMANVNGLNIHYVIGGQGEPLVLVHGFGQNWYMWNRLLPELSKHFTVIAPDLRGVGESDKPQSGYDKKTMATDIHELVKKLGYKSINLAGHDIGLMVAYAYAVQYPEEVKKIALMDALIPGVEPVWKQISTTVWHFGFFARPVAGDLVAGQEREFLTDFWPTVGYVKNPFTKEESDEFIRAYATKGSTTGSFHWFKSFPQDVEDNHAFMKQKINMPLLAMGGEYFSAPFLADHSRLVASNVQETKIMGAGHWLVQEQTAQVQKGLLDFFLAK